ncbi:hypothetical protein [Actinomadura sp. 9N407]|uniref:hypothetical protein n=1 Tax=Actinomadura sp. 9N407 TaxID=3375154 RepID=UPI0037A9C0D5
MDMQRSQKNPSDSLLGLYILKLLPFPFFAAVAPLFGLGSRMNEWAATSGPYELSDFVVHLASVPFLVLVIIMTGICLVRVPKNPDRWFGLMALLLIVGWVAFFNTAPTS